MQPNFLHLKASPVRAISFVEEWSGNARPHYEAELEVEDNGWVTLSMDLSGQPIEEWLSLGARVDLLYEFYSTSIRAGEIVYISSQRLIRHLVIDAKNPMDNIDIGQLHAEHERRFQTWGDIWGFVEDWKWLKEVEPIVA